jgi:hypothetical protein
VDFGFAVHFSIYLQGWHQNLVSTGLPLQLGVELELPVVTLDLLGEGSIGIGYGNLFEYHVGGMAELLFLNKRIGFGVGAGIYGSSLNFGDTGSAEEASIAYASPIETSYLRLAFILRNSSQLSLYAELYGDGNWGFGVMTGVTLPD